MVGQGLLRECLLDPEVTTVLSIGRSGTGQAFVYVSGAGADSSERGRVMRARVRGETENAVLRLPFRTAAIVRPAGIIPLHGITSRTPLYRIAYTLTRPFWPVLSKAFPQYVTTTERLGRGLLRIAMRGTPTLILEAGDINALTADKRS